MEVTGSLQMECERRLANLYTESHDWLLKVANKVTKHKETSEDLVQELYEYLHKRQNSKLFWGENSYNLKYCSKFLHHRFLNKTKKLNRTSYVETLRDLRFDEEYDTERDISIETAHKQVLEELKHLSKTKMFASAKIFELYWMSTDTMDEVADKIKISKSTTFLAIKKIRKHLEQVIDNPFKED